MLSTRDHTLFEFSALIGHNVLDTLSLEFNCCVEVLTNYFIPKEIPDGSLKMRMTSAYLDDIIDEVRLSLSILGHFMIDLSLRYIR